MLINSFHPSPHCSPLRNWISLDELPNSCLINASLLIHNNIPLSILMVKPIDHAFIAAAPNLLDHYNKPNPLSFSVLHLTEK